MTNIKEVSNAEEAVVAVMTLSAIQVMINILMRMMPCPIQTFDEKGRIIEDHFGSGVGLKRKMIKTIYMLKCTLELHKQRDSVMASLD